MPLLARLLSAPLVVDVRPGNLENLGSLLADQRISTTGRVAIVVGARRSAEVIDRLKPLLAGADWFVTPDGSIDTHVWACPQRHLHQDDHEVCGLNVILNMLRD